MKKEQWEQDMDKRNGFHNDLCMCGHERKHHEKSNSINYTDGECEKCNCLNYLQK